MLLLLACADPAPEPRPDRDSPGDGDSSGDSTGDSNNDSTGDPLDLPAAALVYDDVTVVDVAGVREHVAVVVAEGQVWDVVDAGQAWPDDAEVRTGGWVVPGLVDAHVHLAYAGTTTRVSAPLAQDLRASLLAGVTQVVDVGGPEALFAVRDAVDAGTLVGPRIFATGPFLTAAGSHPCETAPDPALCTFVDAGDAAQAAADRRAAGADGLKVALCDAAFTPWGATPRLELDALDEIVGEGLPVLAHVDTDEDVVDAVARGVTVLAHPPFADDIGEDALAAAATAAGVASTVSAFAGVVDLVEGRLDPWDPALALDDATRADWAAADPDAMLAGWVDESRAWTAHVRANLPALRDAGATVLPGSDAGYWFVPHGMGLHRELAELVDAGWTPTEALVAATSESRVALGLPGGRIAAGEPADLLLLGSDPTLDVAALQDLDAVLVGGVPVDLDALATMDLGDPDGACLDDGDCAADEACDGLTYTCVGACPTPYAIEDACGEDAWCSPAEAADDADGACHAEADCDLYAQDCEPAWYAQACLPYDADTNACWTGGPRDAGESCSWTVDALACKPGLFCSWVDYTCYTLCDPDAADPGCPPRQRCVQQVSSPGVPWFGLCL